MGKVLDMFVLFLLSPGHPHTVTLEAGCCDRWPLSLSQYGHSCVLTYPGNISLIPIMYLYSLHFLNVYSIVQTSGRRDETYAA